jgi:hypothetical protein
MQRTLSLFSLLGNLSIANERMKSQGFLRVATAALVCCAYAGSASAKPPQVYPLSQVKRGQKGYGLSTFAGTKPTRWEFEVIGVMDNFRPKMSIILVKSEDPKMQETGFWRGMSGSPLFIDDKLVCAFSYGFQFNKRPIGGCTPIQFMIDEGLKVPVRGEISRGTTASAGAIAGAGATPWRWIRPGVADRSEWRTVAPAGDVDSALAHLGPPRQPWLMRAPLPPAGTYAHRPDAANPDAMVPAALPLAISGFSASAYEQARKLMAPYPVDPMQAGGTGDATAGPNEFALGGPIAVQLARGDASFAATGTVSYKDGARVLAFGHPFFEQGEFYAPVTAAEVHTVIPSQVSGFVMASPLRELGSLVQDRLPAIMADTSFRNRLIPMAVVVDAGQGKDLRKLEFHVEILHNRFLTAPLAALMAMNAVTRFLPDRDDTTVTMESTIALKGRQPLHFVDYLHAADGAASIIGGARGLRVLVPLLFNPFAPVEIERIEIKLKLSFSRNYGNIVALRLGTAELTPGKRNYVDVVMQRFDDSEVVERIPFDVPAHLAGSIVSLSVVPGDAAKLDAAPPDNLDDLLASFRKLLPGNTFAVTLNTAGQGVAVGGKLIRDLPASAFDRFHPEARTQHAATYTALYRSIVPSSRVINGGMKLIVRVADQKNN